MSRIALAIALLCAPILAHAGSSACDQAARQIPARPAQAPSGSRFVRSLEELTPSEREEAIRSQLLSGNIPRFLRRLAAVTLSGNVAGQLVHVTVCVSPDYLAIGSDDDYLLVPMRLGTALDVARRFGFVLPTTKLVDAIYEQARVRLRPQPLPPGERMRSTDYYAHHNLLVREQRMTWDAPLGSLTAGDKKDLVLTDRLVAHPDRVAIYGWHEADEQPIQPLSTVHGIRYADYSHGVRLVGDVAFVNGQRRSILDLLEDPQLSVLLDDEGPAVPRRSWLATALEAGAH